MSSSRDFAESEWILQIVVIRRIGEVFSLILV